MIPVADQDLADALADIEADEAERYTLDDCGSCAGTGEGATCKATCWVCRGSGLVRVALPAAEPVDEDEEEAEAAHA